MHNLTKTVLKRPVATLMALLALVVFGFSSLTSFELESTPEMNMPMLMVMTTYDGADPETIDELITDPIEELGNELEGIDQIQSRSSEGQSTVMFQFDYGTDITETYLDLKTKVDSVNLPDECDTPTIMEMQMDSSSIMTIQVRSDENIDLLSYVEETVQPKLESLTGVSEVSVMGGSETYIKIVLNEEAMTQYGLTIDEVSSAIAATDYTVPADSVTQGTQDISISSSSEITDMAELYEIPISTDSGTITLRDIATVSYGLKESESLSRHNGESNISIDVTKKQSASTVTVAEQVKAELEELQAAEPGVELEITSDTSEDIIEQLSSVGETLVIGIFLSMLTLFLFFGDIKASLIVGSSMPISLLATLIVMSFAGFTLNMITTGALVIAIGMMVDSSVVVIESCFRSRDKGLSYKQSAYEGTKEVAASIVASTITTVVVYIPISLIGGMSGQMFKQLGFTIIFAMLASLIAALTIIPLFFYLFSPEEKKNAPAVKIMEVVSKKYARAVRKVIPKKITVLIISVSLLAIAGFLATQLNMELMTTNDEGQFTVTIDSRTGSTLDTANDNALPYEEVIAADEDIESYDIRVQDASATITCYVSDDSGKTTTDKVDEYSALWAHESGVDITVEEGGSMAGFSSSGASVTLEADDYDELKTAVYSVVDAIGDVDGVLSVTSDLGQGSTSAKIYIDPKKAMNEGLTPSSVASTIANINGGVDVLTIKSDGDEYDCYLEFPDGKYDDLNSLMNIKLTNSDGKEVSLSTIAEIRYEDEAQTIRKSDGVYSISVEATTSDANKFTVQQEVNKLVASMDLGKSVSIGTSSMNRMMNDEFSSLGNAIATAIFLVFLVMAMQFESPRFSFMVMISLPFSMIGSVGLLYATNSTISMNSLMGFLMLVGIVVNNGILFVDTANMLKADYPIQEALAKSGEIRLRPIMMTTLTTILSMVPLVMNWGSNTAMLQGMGVIIIGGLTASTILILFMLPTFYMMFMGKKARRLEKERWQNWTGAEEVDDKYLELSDNDDNDDEDGLYLEDKNPEDGEDNE